MKDTKLYLTNSCSLDRPINITRYQLSKGLNKYNRYPFTYFSQREGEKDRLVSRIQRGNRLQTPTLYAELAIYLMCQNYNAKGVK